MCKGFYRNIEWKYYNLIVECNGGRHERRSRQFEQYEKLHEMPPIPAAGSGICTVTGAQGNAKAGTPCTGYYYSGIEGRCTGTACCQGTGYGGHGWSGLDIQDSTDDGALAVLSVTMLSALMKHRMNPMLPEPLPSQ